LQPWQQQYLPGLTGYASLLFLPHGIRVLSAWLLGWKSIPLLAPAALFTHWLNFGAQGFSLAGTAGAMSGVVCAAFSFWVLSYAGMDFRITAKKTASWTDVILAGCIASTLNTFGMGFVYQHNLATLSGYFWGDITGLLACMFFIMLAFRSLR